MFVVFFFAIVAVACAQNATIQAADDEAGKIINGQLARVGQFPWQAGIFYFTSRNERKFCGGALINNEWILTAAHCVKDMHAFEIFLGGTSATAQESGKVVLAAKQATYHNQFNPTTLANDVALIKLQSTVQFTSQIQPIRLARRNDYLQANVKVTTSGWGKISDSAPGITNNLNFVELQSITNDQCKQNYRADLIQITNFCCVGAQKRSTCNGDSGGPVYKIDTDGKPTHVGIVSFVDTRGCEFGYPSGFARTSSYIDFISSITGISFP